MKSILVFERPYEVITIVADDEADARSVGALGDDFKVVKVMKGVVDENTDSQVVSWYLE